MGQYSFTGRCLAEEPSYSKVLKFLHLHKIWERIRYKEYQPVPKQLQEEIFNYVKNKLKEFEKNKGGHSDIRDLNTRGIGVLKKYHGDAVLFLKWSVKDTEFDQSILMWHIATELRYDHVSSGDIKTNVENSLFLSKYMMYLLVMYPSLLPVGLDLIMFLDTLWEAKEFISDNKSNDWKEKLLGMKTYDHLIKVKGDRCKSVLSDACRVVSEIKKIKDPEKEWKLIRDVWLEMFTYAASQGRGSDHGHQLRRGGELLSHVWLLLAHFGMTDQFQISKGRGYLIAK